MCALLWAVLLLIAAGVAGDVVLKVVEDGKISLGRFIRFGCGLILGKVFLTLLLASITGG